MVGARTLEEVKDALLECSARLHDLGIFRGVDILADKSETVRALVASRVWHALERRSYECSDLRAPWRRLTPPLARQLTPGRTEYCGLDCDCAREVRCVRKHGHLCAGVLCSSRFCGTQLSLTLSARTQGDEGSVEATVRLNNPLGHAEQLELVAAAGSQHSSTLAVTAVAQRLWDTSAKGELRLGQTTRSFQRHSSFTEQVRSSSAPLLQYRMSHPPQPLCVQLRGVSITVADGYHSWAYELAWRALADPSRCASSSIRAGLGHGVKSAVRHTYFWDGRDNDLWPRSGAALRCVTELSGLTLGSPSSARHIRLDAEGQACTPLTASGATLALTARCGVLLPLWASSTGQVSHLSDRFFLGGADSLRGFSRAGVGPTDQRRAPPEGTPPDGRDAITRDALGGDLLCSGCAAITFPLPLEALQDTTVHGHCFVQCGTLLPLAASPLGQVASTMRVTAGLGIVLPTRLGRLEVNYCVPLKSHAHDRLRHGMQVGLRTLDSL